MFEYRTKPVRVEAVQWRLELSWENAPLWLLGALDFTNNRLHGKIKRIGNRAQVATAKGTVMADIGDWIVYWKATSGALEVFKADEFERKF